MVRRMSLLVVFSVLLAPGMSQVHGQALRGSEASVMRAYVGAEDHDFTFLQTSEQIERFVEAGYLVRVRSRRDFVLHDVSFPYGRPAVKLFIERLGAQYRRACGEELVVTSLTRPLSKQPRNASIFSVHPTGMAVDFRTSLNSVCRHWLESTLLYLEGAGVLEATRERQPSHYHVAVFPELYVKYVEGQLASARSGDRVTASRYMVRAGDSLWAIARIHGTTVPKLKAANDIRGSRIYAGQLLTVPMVQ
ncbi:MAG: LysM peptidoglycan-binding domain-containing protein [Gemmatimonadetes bacterium]|nr:LysM peptidoglycan-binding domain-containing protein [Gemmatimonadota bacterium]